MIYRDLDGKFFPGACVGYWKVIIFIREKS